MLILFGPSHEVEWNEAVVCVGTFDGVHLGHQAVIREAVAQARSAELPCVVVTFDRHPATVLAPDRVPLALQSLDQNLHEFEGLGVSATAILTFDKAMSERSAEEFFSETLQGWLKASRAVIGHDFAFGKGREGTPEWLAGKLPTQVVPPFQIDGQRVSSSRIRALIQEGDVEKAATQIGRPFTIFGVVVSGQKLGRTLGYPTVNLARTRGLATPADGVYAGQAHLASESYRAAISIGMRPAVGGTHRTIEAFLLDYPGDSLYGQTVRLEVSRRLRNELNFESLDRLKEQMALDIEQVRA